MFNIFINDGKKEIPNDDILFIVAKEGIFLKKKVGIMESIAPVGNISTLESIQGCAKLNVSKIPAVRFAKVVEFFKAVDEKHDSECTTMLHYNPDKKRYRIEVPKQEVSPATVDYKSETVYPNYNIIGTIHSHSTMSAFHSPTDKKDEADRDGLHITVGKIQDKYPEISAEIVANGSRFQVDPEDYIEGIELVKWKIEPTINFLTHEDSKDPKIVEKIGYKINVKPEKRIFNRKWLDQVEKKTFKQDKLSSPYEGVFSKLGLFEGTDIDLTKFEDVNPCEACPFREFKIEMQIDEIFDEMDDDDLAELEELGGFEIIDDEDFSEIEEGV